MNRHLIWFGLIVLIAVITAIRLHLRGGLQSWRTTLLGVFAICLGVWSATVVWVPTQTVYFNVVYVLPAQTALLIAGWGLIHAKDHAHKDK